VTREWKPGDVAALTIYGSDPARGYVTLNDDREALMWRVTGHSFFKGVAVGNSAIVTDARPLVVIDPEDREQVERLGKVVARLWHEHPYVLDAVQAALREFANPTPPKPEEPTGLGAVVEDADGVRWVLNNPRGYGKWSRENAAADGLPRDYKTWRMVTAVRVLSEGVTP